VRTAALALLCAVVQDAKPTPLAARGRLVCVHEEMQRAHGVEIPPVHEHVLGFRAEGDVGGLRCFTVLRTALSKRLFEDARYRDRDLRITGRVYPGTANLEVQVVQWWKDGALSEVWYWCDVCSIKGVDPALCACCQAPVELKEGPAE
jgi:hypothetical protein